MSHYQSSDQEAHGTYGPQVMASVEDDSSLAGGDAVLPPGKRAAGQQTKHSDQCSQWRSCFDDDRAAGKIVAPESSTER